MLSRCFLFGRAAVIQATNMPAKLQTNMSAANQNRFRKLFRRLGDSVCLKLGNLELLMKGTHFYYHEASRTISTPSVDDSECYTVILLIPP